MKKFVILCVDDEKLVLDSLKAELRDALGDEYPIETAENGIEALEVFEELLDENQEVPVVLVDYIMPDLRGDEVLKRIHAIAPRTLKIMLTGQASTEGIINAVNHAGLYRYIGKPWEREDLILTVTEAIRCYLRNKLLEEQNERVRASEEKYRSIFENALEGIFQSTPEGCFVGVNPSMARILGYGSTDELTTAVTDVRNQVYVDPRRRDELVRLLQKFDSTSGYECQLYRKDGSTIWAEMHLRALKNSYGEIVLIEGRVEDISRRKEALEKLSDSERKFRKLYESSRDGWARTDMEGQFIECNSAWCEMIGYTFEELQRLKVPDITPEKWRPVERNILRTQAMKRGFTDVYEKEFIRKGGETFPTEIRVYLIRNEEGEAEGFWGFVRDVSEKKKLQAEAMRQARLASLGELAAGVAHEINNPINSIINYAQILVNRGVKKNEEVEIPTRIIKEGDRIESIVKDLLSFARERKEEKQLVDVRDILSDTLSLTRTFLGKENIRIHVDFSGNLPLIRANAQQIQQIFFNIINNARYALNRRLPKPDPEKVLEIKSEAVEQDGKQVIRITFYDRGEGIPSSVIDKICDPFFSTKPYDKGTGLGLSISHGIVKDHDGRLWFESVEGEYTKAIIELPGYERDL